MWDEKLQSSKITGSICLISYICIHKFEKSKFSPVKQFLVFTIKSIRAINEIDLINTTQTSVFQLTWLITNRIRPKWFEIFTSTLLGSETDYYLAVLLTVTAMTLLQQESLLPNIGQSVVNSVRRYLFVFTCGCENHFLETEKTPKS